jgi:hypothetical protein
MDESRSQPKGLRPEPGQNSATLVSLERRSAAEADQRLLLARRLAAALGRQAAAEAWSEAEQVNIAGSRTR